VKQQLAKFGSLKLTVALLLPLIGIVFLINRSDAVSTAWVAVPLFLLSLNLLAAIATNTAFRRQPALLVFHICLLAMIVFAGLGALTQFDGHVELVEGESFDPSRIEVTEYGLLHGSGPESVHFTQGRIAIDYEPGLIRQTTISDVSIGDEIAYPDQRRIGDRTTMTIDGYRFSTSFNKGFAAVVHWAGKDGEEVLGAINLPAYPEYEWKQVNEWTTPGGEVLQFELQLEKPVDKNATWRLQSDGVKFAVQLTRPDGVSSLLRPGERLAVNNGVVTVVGLRMWMGYRVDSNPMLLWVFISAFSAVAALCWHFNRKYWGVRSIQPVAPRRAERVCLS
jgi:hypothetical protein